MSAPVIAAVIVVLAFVLLAFLVGRVTGITTQRMRGGADDMRRADDGGPGNYSDYSSPMG